MTISIPQSLFDKYNEVCDWFIDNDNIGRACTLVYAPKKTQCSNCTVKMVGSTTINTYRHGGPMFFQTGKCPLCGGSGIKEVEYTDTIRLRIYWNRADWIRIAGSINIADAEVMVIGYMADLPNFRKAKEVLLASDQKEAEYRAIIAGKPTPWGFGRSRYFVAYLKGA